jgi:hypothetical protein
MQETGHHHRKHETKMLYIIVEPRCFVYDNMHGYIWADMADVEFCFMLVPYHDLISEFRSRLCLLL